MGRKCLRVAIGLGLADVLKAAGADEGELMVGVVWYGMPGKPLDQIKAPKRNLGANNVLTKVA